MFRCVMWNSVYSGDAREKWGKLKCESTTLHGHVQARGTTVSEDM